MSFLFPGFFYASLAVAAGVVALHFIVRRQPRAGILPTARFIPDIPATAVARAKRPSDVPLMLLRVLLVLAAGAGLARPVFEPSRQADIRVILADVSRSVTDTAALRDSVESIYRDGDALIAFDSSARTLSGSVQDSLNALGTSRKRGNLSAGLIAAVRAGSNMREQADSLELVIVSPFHADAADAAMEQIRGLWPGRARLIRAGSNPATDSAGRPWNLALRANPGDPLAVTGRIAVPSVNATIVRDGASPDADAQGVSIDWPAGARPRGAVARASVDTIGGVVSGDALVISNFPRQWTYSPDSIGGAEIVARWIDGEPAAVEWESEFSCIRSVAVPVTGVGDLAIRADFIRFVEAIAAPCAHERPFVAMSQSLLANLAGSGGLAPREAFAPVAAHSWIAPWLLGLALIAGIAELFVRSRRRE